MADENRSEKQGPVAGAGKIDMESLRQLLALMSEHGLAELEIEQEDMAVRLRKAVAAAPAAVAPAAAAPAAGAAAHAARAPKENLPSINSPMVGTFYVAASPEAAPLVKIGDHVAEDTVVCIIEAMKVFNEIQAEMSGTIEKVLARNAEAVEFGQPMFVVRPD